MWFGLDCFQDEIAALTDEGKDLISRYNSIVSFVGFIVSLVFKQMIVINIAKYFISRLYGVILLNIHIFVYHDSVMCSL